MKSNSNLKFVVPALLAAAFLWIGCQSKLAPLSSITTAQITYPVFIFPSSSSVTINPNLPINGATAPATNVGYYFPSSCYGCPVTAWSYPISISVTQPATLCNNQVCLHGTYSSPCVFQPTGVQSNVQPSGLSQYPLDVHVTGWIQDPESPLFLPGPGNYDSVYLRAWPNLSGPGSTYDLTPFQGIRFYIYVSPIDNAPSRQFQVPSLQNEPGPGPAPSGMCQNPNDPVLTHCYDPFYYDFTDIRKGEWVLIQKNWGDLKQFGNGSQPNPPTFSGLNLQQAVYFGWVEGNSALATPVTIDFSVTGCELF